MDNKTPLKIQHIASVEQLVHAVGRKNIAAIGFREQDISRAIADDLFSAGWQPFIRDLCVERNILSLNMVPELDRFFRNSKVPLKSLSSEASTQ